MINYELIGKTLIHPIQQEILDELHRYEADAVMSPSEIAKRVGREVSAVAYHVTALAGGTPNSPSRFFRTPLIELTDVKPVRGALEHFYRLTEHATMREAIHA